MGARGQQPPKPPAKPTQDFKSPPRDPNERRRTQIRAAQRAYRARNQAESATLKRRLAQLEKALEEISQGVVSLSDSLVQSDVLRSYPQVADRLRDTVETCLALAKSGDEDLQLQVQERDETTQPASVQTQSGRRSPQTPQRSIPSMPAPAPILPNRYLSPTWFTSSPFPFPYPYRSSSTNAFSTTRFEDKAGTMAMPIPHFIETIRLASLHHGLRLLDDPSIPLTILARPFRLLLPLVPRETITLFFRARLQARLAKQQPHHFAEIPFFQLGGAGTHYVNGFVSNAKRNEMYSGFGYEGWDVVEAGFGGEGAGAGEGEGPLSAFSPQIREELDGEWFDLNDLEGFLLERGVALGVVSSASTSAGDGEGAGDGDQVVNVVDLTAELLRKAICLGHSPGFRRKDVEAAIGHPQR
ncbi:hypothetical protein BJY04DRAFT_224636 [Aspergillus karnatakaensis]|uniref:uncharacterized protein n=1 Tax=Aspergillus karnatakaensis TaxID=1810916 RepID=UPI003CCD9257